MNRSIFIGFLVQAAVAHAAPCPRGEALVELARRTFADAETLDAPRCTVVHAKAEPW